VLRWTEFLAHKERLADLRRQAEREQLVQQVLATREKQHPRYHRAATWLGPHLVAWGCRLQERYGFAGTGGDTSTSEPQPVSRCAVASCRE